MQRRSVIVFFALASLVLAAPSLSPELGRGAREKIERIDQQQMQPGEAIIFTEDELNSLLRYEYASEMPSGVSDASVRLAAERATIRAMVDIGKLQEASGGSFGGLWAMIFQGEREVLAVCRAESSMGRASVEVESVEFGGTPLPATLLRWLISATVADTDTASGNGVLLPETLRELRIESGRATVVAN